MKGHGGPESLFTGCHYVPVSWALQIEQRLGRLTEVILRRPVEKRTDGKGQAINIHPCLNAAIAIHSTNATEQPVDLFGNNLCHAFHDLAYLIPTRCPNGF